MSSCEDNNNLQNLRKDFCDQKIDFQTMSSKCKLELILRTFFITIMKFQFPKQFSSNELDKKTKWKKEIINWDIYTSNYTEHDSDGIFKYLNKLNEKQANYRDILINFDEDWLKRQMFYKQTLFRRDLLIIRSYTLPMTYKIVNFLANNSLNLSCFDEWYKIFYGSFICNRYDYKDCVDKDYYKSYYRSNFFPFFYQLLDVVAQHKTNFEDYDIFKPLFINSSYEETYNHFLKHYDEIISYKKLWFKVCCKFVKDFDIIIKHAPKTENPLILWRGIDRDYINPENNLFIHKNFMSTSIDLNATEPFMNNKSPKCCLIRLLVPANTSCLFIGDISDQTSESEVIFGLNSILKIHPFSNEIWQDIDIVENFTENKPDTLLCDNIIKVKTAFASFEKYKDI
jgi:hypothetical protein